MDLIVTLPPRALDGLIEAGNRNGATAEEIATELLTNEGLRYADLFQIGIVTSAAFMARFTPAEYTAIRTAAETIPEVAALIEQLTNSHSVIFGDPRLEPGLQLLVSLGLLASERLPELLAYSRPVLNSAE